MISLTRKCQAYNWAFMVTGIEKIWFILPFPFWCLPLPCTQQLVWSKASVQVASTGCNVLHQI